jgi:hypothetical protein
MSWGSGFGVRLLARLAADYYEAAMTAVPFYHLQKCRSKAFCRPCSKNRWSGLARCGVIDIAGARGRADAHCDLSRRSVCRTPPGALAMRRISRSLMVQEGNPTGPMSGF